MAYNEFAYFYDEFNGEADYDALYAHIHAKLKEHGIHDGILADLGCGTGELTLMLTQAGYDMIGIDQSEEMLCVVRDKAEQLGLSGRLLLLRQDLLKLDLYGTIRGAVSTFDTFNHIPDLDTAIANAGFFMEKGGVFLFDMNTPHKFRTVYGNNAYVLEAERPEENGGTDIFCAWQNFYDEKTRVCDFDLSIFEEQPDGSYLRSDEYQQERCYDLEEIRSALATSGMELLGLFSDYRFSAPTGQTERWYFAARAIK